MNPPKRAFEPRGQKNEHPISRFEPSGQKSEPPWSLLEVGSDAFEKKSLTAAQVAIQK